MTSEPVLTAVQRAFVQSVRRAVLTTITPDGHPRLVPICFSFDEDRAVLWTPIDDKPKRTVEPLALARVRDLRADPRVTVLFDRWDEDWTRLAWLRAEGSAVVLEAEAGSTERATAIAALRSRYPQYAGHRLESRPLIRISIERVTDWGRLDQLDD
jgi:PPOX class probable F420-dependent enzyme